MGLTRFPIKSGMTYGFDKIPVFTGMTGRVRNDGQSVANKDEFWGFVKALKPQRT